MLVRHPGRAPERRRRPGLHRQPRRGAGRRARSGRRVARRQPTSRPTSCSPRCAGARMSSPPTRRRWRVIMTRSTPRAEGGGVTLGLFGRRSAAARRCWRLLERLDAGAGVVAIEGVMNGTANFLLEPAGRGLDVRRRGRQGAGARLRRGRSGRRRRRPRCRRQALDPGPRGVRRGAAARTDLQAVAARRRRRSWRRRRWPGARC